ncbi:MAG: hypothetical protein HYZ91_03875, partial [Candidatus Omnitrophica bacterium]|nr:hypothetical protein [Candidatus Omnitrophota bacterium]
MQALVNDRRPAQAGQVGIPDFTEAARGGWWLHRWAGRSVVAGVTTRRLELAQLLQALPSSAKAVGAEQVHGASIATIRRAEPSMLSVPG